MGDIISGAIGLAGPLSNDSDVSKTHTHANVLSGSGVGGNIAITSICTNVTDIVTQNILVPLIHPNTLQNPFQTLVFGDGAMNLSATSTGTYSLRIGDKTTNFFIQMDGLNNRDTIPVTLTDVLFQHNIASGIHTFAYQACVSDATTTLNVGFAAFLVWPGLSQGPFPGT